MNRSLLKISVISLLLFSNIASFGMLKPFIKERNAGLHKAKFCKQSDKSFDFFLGLPGDMQYDVLRFFASDDLDSFAQTSKKNFATIEQYKEMQKSLTIKYLCARKKNDSVLAQQIKQDNPNLPLFYCFPSWNWTDRNYAKFDERLHFNFLSESNYAVPKREQKKIIKKWAMSKDRLMLFDLPSSFAMACLSGDCNSVKKELQDGKVGCYKLLFALMIAINEQNDPLSELLLDSMNHEFRYKGELETVLLNTLRILKSINNVNAFKLVVNKIPSNFLRKNRYDGVSYFDSLLKSMLDVNNICTFDESDIALVHLRKKKLEEEVKPVICKQEDQSFCVIF